MLILWFSANFRHVRKFGLRRSRSCEQLQTNVGYRWQGLGWGFGAFWKPKNFPAKNVPIVAGPVFFFTNFFSRSCERILMNYFFTESPNARSDDALQYL